MQRIVAYLSYRVEPMTLYRSGGSCLWELTVTTSAKDGRPAAEQVEEKQQEHQADVRIHCQPIVAAALLDLLSSRRITETSPEY